MASKIVQSVRDGFATGKTIPLSFRRQQLKNMLRMLEECRQEIIDALYADLRKSEFEACFGEIEILKAEVRGTLSNLEEWTKDEKLPNNLLSITDTAYVHKDPFGVVLIIGTWNYPINMALCPLIGAIAAGNAAVIKPSEVSAASAAALGRIVPRYLDTACYQVFEGDVSATIELLNQKFDYIFYTGSSSVGKSIMQAASKNLTPVTLELGGKSPAYIDDTVNMERTAKRIMWGKVLNLGQTCIAPDYVLISKKRQKEFLDAASKVLAEWVQKGADKDSELTRIINQRHFQRVKNILDSTKGRIAVGGQSDESSLWISPAIVVDVDPDTDPTMQDELFGPILPIVNVESPEAAMKFILNRPKPLALYVFTENKDLANKFVAQTSSGAVLVNDVIYHCAWDGLPFGGVGNSGTGQYHGKYSVDTFSHKKAVLHRGINFLSEKAFDFRYPPYEKSKLKLLATALKIMPSFSLHVGPFTTHAVAAVVGAGIAAGVCALI